MFMMDNNYLPQLYRRAAHLFHISLPVLLCLLHQHIPGRHQIAVGSQNSAAEVLIEQLSSYAELL
jgi:hypothetical protein